MDTIRIVFTPEEVAIGSTVGMMRRLIAIAKKRQDNYNIPPGDPYWEYDINGALGEQAVAKALGLYWNGNFGHFHDPDVGPYDVRTAKSFDLCCLVHQPDDDERVCISVVGSAPAFELVGWIWNHDAKVPRFWKDPKGKRPAFFVPNTRPPLQPMGTLPKIAG